MPTDVHLPLDRLTLDLRSPAGRPFDGASRLVTNLLVQEDGGLRRMGGFPRLGYAEEDQNNQDLHDQMLQATKDPLSKVEPVTLLFEAKPSTESRRIIAATRSRIYASGGLDRNWRMLGWGFGGGEDRPDHISDATRFYADELGDIIVLTNGLDRPMWTILGVDPDEETGMAVHPIDDLIALGVTSAKVVCCYRGFVFLGSVVMEGNTYRHRIIWSDFNDPLSFTPLPNSLAGSVDLAADEEVLAMKELGGSLRCYTTHRIYDVNMVGGEEIFNFRQLWEGPEVLRYRNSLVATGNQHLWVGEDRIYYITETDRRPRAEEWLYAASGAIFTGIKAATLEDVPDTVMRPFGRIDTSSCWELVGGFDDIRKTIWLSWPTAGSAEPDISLVLHTPSQRSTIVTRGFTSFLTHSKAYRASVRLWLGLQGICEPETMTGEGNPVPREYKPIEELLGLPYRPKYIRNTAECSGLIPEYAQWLAENGLCNGGQGPCPQVGTSALSVKTVEYVSEYVIPARGNKTPDEFLTKNDASKLLHLITSQYRYHNASRGVRVVNLSYQRSSVEATVLPLDKSSGGYVADLIDYSNRSDRLDDYWLVTARLATFDRVIPDVGPVTTASAPIDFELDFYAWGGSGGESPPGSGDPRQICADARLNELLADWNASNAGNPDQQYHEIGPRTWTYEQAASSVWKLDYLVDPYACDYDAFRAAYQNNSGVGGGQGNNPFLINRYQYMWTYRTVVAIGPPPVDPETPPTPTCDFTLQANKPSTPIVQTVPFDITAIVQGGANLTPVDQWVFTWALEGEVPGVAEIVSTSGSVVTLRLDDSLERELTLILDGTGCAQKAIRVIVQAVETEVVTPPACPTAALIFVFPTSPPYGSPFNATLVVNASAGMSPSSTWEYTWTLTNTVNGLSEIVSTVGNVATVKLSDTDEHILKVSVDFKMPGCTYPEPSHKFQLTEIPSDVLPCNCNLEPNALCPLLVDPKCDECSAGWVFIAAGAGFLCNAPAPATAPMPPEYSLKEYSTSELRWEYYKAPSGPMLPWTDTKDAVNTETECSAATLADHPTVPMDPQYYMLFGYASMLQVDSNTFGTQNEKKVLRATIDYATEDVPDLLAAWLHVWTGTGAQAGQLLWTGSTARRLDRLSLRKSDAHKIQKTRPARLATYNFFQSGAHVAFRIIIATEDVKPVIGGAVSLNWMKGGILGARNDYF